MALAFAGTLVAAGQASAQTPAIEPMIAAPELAYLGEKIFVGGDLYNPDPNILHHDVAFDTTIAGSFEPAELYFKGDPTWTCSADTSTPGYATVACHAEELQYWDGFQFGLIPTDIGFITVDATLSEGGVFVADSHATVEVVEATDADLGLFIEGGGDALLGQEISTPVFVYNNGPLSATGVAFGASLAGSGRLLGVEGWSGDTGEPIDCDVNDSEAACDLGDLTRYSFDYLVVRFEGTAVGEVALTANVGANEPDPDLSNNTATSYFNLIEPKYADLSVAVTDAPDPVSFKKPLTYTIVVSNLGPDEASGVAVADSFPSEATFVSVTATQGSCDGGQGYIFCYLGALPAGGSATVVLQVKPAEGGALTSYTGVWNEVWQEVDPDESNNYAQTTTTVKGPNPPVTTLSSVGRFPFTMFSYVPCVDDFVIFEGTLHEAYHVVYNESAGWARFSVIDNPQGLRGTAVGSGTKYQATGMTRSAEKYGQWLPTSYEYQNNFRLIGQGPGNDLVVHVVEHVTFEPDGTPHMIISKSWTDCK